jgi:hypothetical protein
MTSTFTGRLGKIFKYVLYSDNTLITDKSSENIIKKLLIGSGFAGLHGAYVFSTSESEEIKVVKKYTMDRNGFTNFMVVDDKNRHFNVNNSLWYWKWDSIEDWNKVEENNNLHVKYYGWRIPMFGLFPNIVKSSDKPLNTPTQSPPISSAAAVDIISPLRQEDKIQPLLRIPYGVIDTVAMLKGLTPLQRNLILIREEEERKKQYRELK